MLGLRERAEQFLPCAVHSSAAGCCCSAGNLGVFVG